MSWLEAAALGALQGLTEFLPVSSSGHLVIGQAVLGIPPGGVTFEVVVHLGTMAAILMVFGRDLLSLLSGAARLEATSLRMLGVLAVASVPAAVAGLLLRSSIEGLFGSPALASAMLLVTGTLLWATRFAPRAHGEGPPGFSRGLAIGVAQAVAIIPGISRSGATIAAGLMVGVERRAAAEFSFLLAIPAIAGAALLDLPESDLFARGNLWPLLTGFFVSAAVGWIALRALLGLVRHGRLYAFSWYCWLVGCAGLVAAFLD